MFMTHHSLILSGFVLVPVLNPPNCTTGEVTETGDETKYISGKNYVRIFSAKTNRFLNITYCAFSRSPHRAPLVARARRAARLHSSGHFHAARLVLRRRHVGLKTVNRDPIRLLR